MQKGFYRKASFVGVGGWKCACCGPAPGQDKKKHRRTDRRIFSQLIDKLVKEELDDLNNKELPFV